MSKEQMPAHDDLPRRLRKVLAELPFNINARDVLKLVRTPGWSFDRVERRIRELGVHKHWDESLDPEQMIAPDQLQHKGNWI